MRGLYFDQKNSIKKFEKFLDQDVLGFSKQFKELIKKK